MFERLFGIYLIGFVIKFMDDYLDQDLDKMKEEWNFTIALGKGVLPYSLVILIFALHYNFSEGLAFFASSYLIGMFYSYNERLPSGLKGWQEGMLIFVFSILVTSFKNSLAALILILLLQFIDDFLDYRTDLYTRRENYIYSLGPVNSALIFSMLLIFSIYFFLEKLLIFGAAASLLYLTFWIISYSERKIAL